LCFYIGEIMTKFLLILLLSIAPVFSCVGNFNWGSEDVRYARQESYKQLESVGLVPAKNKIIQALLNQNKDLRQALIDLLGRGSILTDSRFASDSNKIITKREELFEAQKRDLIKLVSDMISLQQDVRLQNALQELLNCITLYNPISTS
jgi:hypothetical protein